MKLPTVFLLIISCALGLEQESCYLSEEEEDQCASVCYPIVKPLLRYFEVCQTKDRTNAELQNSLKEINLKYLKLLEQHSAAQDKCTDVALKYAEVQEKFQQTHQELRKSQESLQETTLKYDQVQDKFKKVNIENEELRKKDLQVRSLKTQVTEKSAQIQVLNDRISDLEKSSELGELNKLFSEELEKLQKITKAGQEVKIGKENNDSNVNSVTKVEATNTTTSPSNSEKPIETLPDRCPATQDGTYSHTEIKIPGLEPFEVRCYSNEEIGSGWMQVYYKYQDSEEFNRTYEEYINGFGNPKGEIFMGLEKLHILTNWKPHEVYIYDDVYFYLNCENFVVGDKSEGYMLKKIDGCDGDTLVVHQTQGTKFSTYDRDEDGNPNNNRAKDYGIGWWFDSADIDYSSYLTLYIRRKD